MKIKSSLKQLILLSKKAVSIGVLSLFLSILLVISTLNNGSLTTNAATTTELPPTGLTYENYPALKDVYKDYFSFGIFGKGEIEGLLYNYASYTPGNEMKPENTQKEKGIFTYTSADNAMKTYSDRNPDILFSGHTLAWHSQTPTWMWDAPPARYDQPGEFDRETALENLNTHIENVLGYYGSRIEGIDVVNEAIGTSNPDDWKASLDKGEGWFMALGWEWVELAFLKAAEVVDSNGWDVKLVYNDFGLDSPDKARVVYEMVKDINEKYADVRPNGKPLIEVIGMQGHYNLSTNVKDVEKNIKLFATLPGVEVNVTEMDIALPPGELTSENENNQGMKYAELFQIYRNYAAGSANTTGNPKVIGTVKLAGVRDVRTGWKGGEFAMPYDYDGQAKKALLGILYPEEFLATHEYIEPDTEGEQKQIDGVYVYDTSKGDSWSGANIILGNDASQWPWSTTDEDGKVAFTPEKDTTYRLSFNYTAKGTTSIRVRWINDNSNGGYTSADGADVNSYPYNANEVAKHIPAYFNSGMVNMGSYTLTTEIKLDGSQPADGLIGNIAIRGGGGGNAFSINWIKVEEVRTNEESDILHVNWPEDIEDEDPVEGEDSVEMKALEELLAEVATYVTEDYTEETFTTLMVTVDEAWEVLANEGVTQEAVDAAFANIEAAVAGLVAVAPNPDLQEPDPEPEPEPEPKPEGSEDDPTEKDEEGTKDPETEDVTIEPDDDKEESVTADDENNDNALPQTATNHFNWLLGGLILLMVGTTGLFIRKRKVN